MPPRRSKSDVSSHAPGRRNTFFGFDSKDPPSTADGHSSSEEERNQHVKFQEHEEEERGEREERKTLQSDEISSKQEEDDIMEVESQRDAITCFRWFVCFLMLAFILAAGITCWKYLENQEFEEFLDEFDVVEDDIKLFSGGRFSRFAGDFKSLSSTITALSIDSKTVWPYFTDSNFEMIVSDFGEKTGSHMAFIAPIINGESELFTWKNYSHLNQGWIKNNLAIQGDPTDKVTDIFPGVFRVSATGNRIPVNGSAPFAPVWQMVETPQRSTVFNFDLLSDPHYNNVFQEVVKSKAPTMTDLLGSFLNDFNRLMDNHDDHRGFPVSLLLYPVFEDETRQKIVAILNSEVHWISLFGLPTDEKVPPVDVVIDEGCEQRFTFRVDSDEVEFLGYGDLHDPNFNGYETTFPFSTTIPAVHIASSECAYNVSVYPTQEFYDTYNTNMPRRSAGIITAVFVVTCFIFFLYDAAVHERQKRILRVAAQSEKILAVLYPKSIRDRLFGTSHEEETTVAALNPASKARRKHDDFVKKATKYQLKHFMKDAPSSEAQSMEYFDSKPIADLFSQATVLFADIAGFTAWSSVREPTQVFTLLETVYQAFDVIARRRKVFKVETVGDCYIAVTGLPDPAKDHANIMAGFARECVSRFGELVGALETTLGPDTGDLGIRVGLHSGPVTAGVLRGDKSRFQLFGDTVNTCARIESSGKRDRIHLSEETAELLTHAGKGNWLRKRDQLVNAKGKGTLQTYWLLTKEEAELEAMQAPNGDLDDGGGSEFSSLPNEITQASLNLKENTYADIEALLSRKTRRLCEWNVDVLVRLLKRIVAHRNASSRNYKDYDMELTRRENQIRSRFMVLDELVEILPLPGFDPRVYKKQQKEDDVVLPEAVVEQIRLYVACIAAMYRDNPFHNFEHASHVMMSVSKLLNRIVAADEVLNANENAAESKDFGWSLHDHTYGITSDPMTQFSVILAALVHDVDHSGVSNFQLIKEKHKLASIFKDKSVAEQNSIVLAWDILMDPCFRDFRRTIYAAPFELERFRQLMANTVLATDIFDKQLQTLRRKRWEIAFSQNTPTRAENTRDNVNRKATIVIEHLIQASDVAHTMQHWHIYRKWNERLFHEMAVAFKAGRMENNPADMWYQGELGFFDNYVIPLAKKLKNCGVFGVASDEYLNYAVENRREWKEKGQAFVAELVQRFIESPGEDTAKLVEGHKRNHKRMSLDLTSPHFKSQLSPTPRPRGPVQWREPTTNFSLGDK